MDIIEIYKETEDRYSIIDMRDGGDGRTMASGISGRDITTIADALTSAGHEVTWND